MSFQRTPKAIKKASHILILGSGHIGYPKNGAANLKEAKAGSYLRVVRTDDRRANPMGLGNRILSLYRDSADSVAAEGSRGFDASLVFSEGSSKSFFEALGLRRGNTGFG
ncbi:MAG TPA: hypothetical protein VKR81_09080 [Candidatus Binatia bacterium]|nr:hypothetical protein [Candidatus Binatia bacterium]